MKLPEIRERSVVRSSVSPSAKYSWSGSFDRLEKGRTTIDNRWARFVSGTGELGAPATTGACAGTPVGVPLGHAHQAAIPIPIMATRLAARAASHALLR